MGSLSPLRKDGELEPNNSCGPLKIAQEKFITELGLGFIILRVSNVYGRKSRVNPGQDVINNWIKDFKNGEVCRVIGSLNAYRDYINVVDVVNAILLANRQFVLNAILHLGSEDTLRTQEILAIFNQSTSGRIKFDFSNSQNFDRSSYGLNLGLAKTLLGWSPESSNISMPSNFITS